ncbi:adenosylcobinamide-phosphate synthase CbiB [Vibrio maerlii]|uniref:adenosylcobinamide-phosphate synthase CbiB n=1 Tax=Vibrio maerlii TaxID=2231648 RepID=UPI000E3C7C94|nr:adenosylcobinamide-phosphate synthase CbiB [Vibrio maerlii]
MPASVELLTNHLLSGALSIICALWLDQLLGEPRRFHPLVGFGRLSRLIEIKLRLSPREKSHQYNSDSVAKYNRRNGALAWFLAVTPPVMFTWLISTLLSSSFPLINFIFSTIILYLTIGGRSLTEHAHHIYVPLKSGDMTGARFAVSMIVSRNTEKMGEKEIASSAIESVLENGNDAVFAPMFWFVIFGAPGAVLLRLANTLDAMWGYKNEKYRHFGFFSAKLDDLLGWVPARITALAYAFTGDFKQALTCWKTQAKDCASPNGGVVMTSGAGALRIKIGGPTYYDGVLHDKKPMGIGVEAFPEAIDRANNLVKRSSFGLSYLWLVCVIGLM